MNYSGILLLHFHFCSDYLQLVSRPFDQRTKESTHLFPNEVSSLNCSWKMVKSRPIQCTFSCCYCVTQIKYRLVPRGTRLAAEGIEEHPTDHSSFLSTAGQSTFKPFSSLVCSWTDTRLLTLRTSYSFLCPHRGQRQSWTCMLAIPLEQQCLLNFPLSSGVFVFNLTYIKGLKKMSTFPTEPYKFSHETFTHGGHWGRMWY